MGYCSYLHGFKEMVLFTDDPKHAAWNEQGITSNPDNFYPA